MGRKKENILTRESTRIYSSYQSGNQFGHSDQYNTSNTPKRTPLLIIRSIADT
jgi:hypothetical protein